MDSSAYQSPQFNIRIEIIQLFHSNVNRYTFVWRGSLNYHLAGLLDTIDSLYHRYNALLEEHNYDVKYELGHARMFVIDGMDCVRRGIEDNRKRKLTKHKKLSNNKLIERMYL